MADRRTTISIDVIGLADLQAANTAMARHNTLVQRLTAAYQGLNAITGSVASGLTSVNTTFNNTNTTINNTSNTVNKLTMNLGGASNAFQGMLPRLLAYRAVSLVFEGVAKSIQQAAEAAIAMERQTARVQRVSTPGSSPFIKAGIAEEVARTGADIKDVGEAFYQFQTRLGDTTTALGATRTALNLVVGTEGDARDVSRAMLQIVSQFPDAFGKSTSEVEKYRRAGELLAITFKDSAAETTELVQALKYLGPIAEATKIPLEQVTGVITALTAEGQRGRMAGTEAAQFVAQIVRNYNQELQGVAGKGQFKDLVFHYKLVEDGTGKIDLLETLKGIVATAKSLPADKAREFLTAISGSQNAFRFLGTTGVEMLQRMAREIQKDRQALQGMTDDSEKLRKDMMTTPQEFQRLWGGAISFVTNLLDTSGMRGYFHDMADQIERGASFMRQLRGLEVGNNIAATNALQGGGRGAVVETQGAVRQAFNNLSRYHSLAPWQQLTAGSELDVASEGMPPAIRQMLAHRYLPGGDTLRQMDMDTMARDLRTMDEQLADRHFGLSAGSTGDSFSMPPAIPGAITSKQSGGLKGLSPAQLANAAIIMRVAKAHGVDPLAMVSVAYAESRLSATNKNPASSATGLFQILASTAPGINRSNALANASFAGNALANMPPGLTGAAAARWIVENFERPGPAGIKTDMAGVAEFYRKHVGGGADTAAEITSQLKQQSAADRDAKAAEKEAQAALKDSLQTARDRTAYYAELSSQNPLAMKANLRASQAQKAAEDYAKFEGDAVGLEKLKDRVEGPLHDLAEKIKEGAKGIAESARTSYDILAEHLNIFDPKLGIAARSAKTKELAAAGDANERRRISADLQGTFATYKKALADALESGGNSVGLSISDPRTGVQGAYASRIGSAADSRIRARQLGQSAPDAASLKADAADLAGVVDTLSKMGITTQTARDMLDQFRDRLQDTNAQLAALGERTAQEATAKLFSDAADKYSRKLNDLDNASLPGVGETPRQAAARERAALANRLDFANRQFAEISGLSSLLSSFLVGAKETPEGKKDLENADIARKQAAAALARFDREQAITRYEAAHGPVAQGAQGAAYAFLSGHGSPADVFRSLGNSIVDTALQQWSKKLTDPLVNVTTKQVLAIQDNTKALGTLNDSMTGTGSGTLVGTVKTSGGDLGGVIVAGLALGAALSGGKGLGSLGSAAVKAGANAAGTKSPKASSGQSDLEKGATAALAAYSIGSNAAQQGVNAGNLIGSALTGADLAKTFLPGLKSAGIIGAGIGLAVDLIGGLFHKRSKPTATPQDLAPAFYNAPSALDLAAYNYSAYGKLPTMQNVGFDVKPANTPIVQVFVDGARVAAQTVISNHLSSVAVSLVNSNMNRYNPI